MKTSKWFALLLAAGFATGGLFILNARAADTLLPEGRGALRGRLLEHVKQKLGLTADQSAQIKTVFKADKDTLTGLLSRLHEAHTGLRAAIQASGATEASVRSASARVAAVEAELAGSLTHHRGLIAFGHLFKNIQSNELLNDLAGRGLAHAKGLGQFRPGGNAQLLQLAQQGAPVELAHPGGNVDHYLSKLRNSPSVKSVSPKWQFFMMA